MYHKNFDAIFPKVYKLFSEGSAAAVYIYLCREYCVSERKAIKISYDQLAQELNLSRNTVRAAIKSLYDRGLVRIRKFETHKDPFQRKVHVYKPMCWTMKGIENFQSVSRSIFATGNPQKSPGSEIDPGVFAKSEIPGNSVAKIDPNLGFSKHKPKLRLTALEKDKKNTVNKQSITTGKERSSPPLRKKKLPLIDSTDNAPSAVADPYEMLAKKLKHTLARANKLTRTDSNVAKWAKQFRSLVHNSDNLDFATLERLVNHFCENLHDQYMPRSIRSADAFCKKIDRVETHYEIATGSSAYEQEEEPTPLPPPPSPEQKQKQEQVQRDGMAHLL